MIQPTNKRKMANPKTNDAGHTFHFPLNMPKQLTSAKRTVASKDSVARRAFFHPARMHQHPKKKTTGKEALAHHKQFTANAAFHVCLLTQPLGG